MKNHSSLVALAVVSLVFSACGLSAGPPEFRLIGTVRNEAGDQLSDRLVVVLIDGQEVTRAVTGPKRPNRYMSVVAPLIPALIPSQGGFFPNHQEQRDKLRKMLRDDYSRDDIPLDGHFFASFPNTASWPADALTGPIQHIDAQLEGATGRTIRYRKAGTGISVPTVYAINLLEGTTTHLFVQGTDSVVSLRVFSGVVTSLDAAIQTSRLSAGEATTQENYLMPNFPSLKFPLLLICAASFMLTLGLGSFFLPRLMPWTDQSWQSQMFGITTAFLLAGFFATWLYSAEQAQEFIETVATGFLGVVSTAISVLFLGIGVFLFWKKLRAIIWP